MRKGFFPRLALSGIRKNRSIYYPYILTAVLTTAMMYIIGSLQQISTDYSGTLAFSLQLGIVVTSVFSVVFLFYTNSFLMRRRKKEFGLYNILGMEKRHLARLIFWETALMLAVSLTLGLAVGVLLDKLMHLVLSRLVGQAVSLTFAVSPGSMRYTAALISITFALILLNSVRQVYVARPVELLRSAEVGEREPKARWLLGLLGPVALLAAGGNLLLVRQGETVLARLPGGRPLTLESALYGLAAACLLGAVVLWFASWQAVLTADKITYLFGRIAPALALLLSLTLSFVPRLRRRLEETDRAQRGLLGQPRRRLDKVGWGAALLSSLLGWSLENAIETADTMRSRGYGLPGRTCFSIYRLDRRDKGLLGWLALSGGYVVAGWAAGGLSYTYYPACQAAGGPGSLSLLTVYLALCLTPLALEAWEERQWKRTTKNTGR